MTDQITNCSITLYNWLYKNSGSHKTLRILSSLAGWRRMGM